MNCIDVLVQCALNTDFSQDYHANCGVDDESKWLPHFGFKCAMAGLNDEFAVTEKYASRITIGYIKHFGFAKLSAFCPVN